MQWAYFQVRSKPLKFQSIFIFLKEKNVNISGSITKRRKILVDTLTVIL